MISVEQFTRQNSVWRQVAPTLDQFTRWANKNSKDVGRAIRRATGVRSDLVAEVAFGMQQHENLGDAVAFAQNRLKGLPRLTEISDSLSEAESLDARHLAENIRIYVDTYLGHSMEWSPKFSGCGRVLHAEGDLVAETTIIEIKSVERAFRGADFRQVLTYCAMAHSVGRQFSSMALLNPRLGTEFRSASEELALDIGAGSWVELMLDLIEAMSLEGVSR